MQVQRTVQGLLRHRGLEAGGSLAIGLIVLEHAGRRHRQGVVVTLDRGEAIIRGGNGRSR
jgi:hypothetical protein